MKLFEDVLILNRDSIIKSLELFLDENLDLQNKIEILTENC